jgi:hypothetical protein
MKVMPTRPCPVRWEAISTKLATIGVGRNWR